jgi:hypothetical protein
LTKLELTSIEESLLPAVSEQEVKLYYNDDHYEMVGYADFMKQLDELEAQIDDYVYKEEDRKSLKSLRAAINKYTSQITAETNAIKKQLFGTTDEQKKTLTNKLSTIASKLSKGIDAEDKRLREEKKLAVAKMFEQAKQSYEQLRDTELECEHIHAASWYNRTTSIASVTKDLDARLKAVNTLFTSQLCPTKDIDTIVDALEESNWDGLAALNLVVENEKARLEALEKAEALKRLQAEKEDKRAEAATQGAAVSQSVTLPVLIKIAGDDWSRAEKVLKAANIQFEKL